MIMKYILAQEKQIVEKLLNSLGLFLSRRHRLPVLPQLKAVSGLQGENLEEETS